MPKKKTKVTCKEFSNVAKLFWWYFCAPTTENTSQVRTKPEIFVNFDPDPKTPARLTTLREAVYTNFSSLWFDPLESSVFVADSLSTWPLIEKPN